MNHFVAGMFVFCSVLWKLALLAGTAYVIEVWHWSPWWFVLTILLILGFYNYEFSEVSDD